MRKHLRIFARFIDNYLYEEISQGISDMHCRSDGYLAEDILRAK